MTNSKRQNYTNEFKDEAVKIITVQGYSVAEASGNLGINPTMLGRWRKEAEHSENAEISAGGSSPLAS
jgi:transposase